MAINSELLHVLNEIDFSNDTIDFLRQNDINTIQKLKMTKRKTLKAMLDDNFEQTYRLEHVEIEIIIDFCLWHRQWLINGGKDIFSEFTYKIFEDFMPDKDDQSKRNK
eukprot:CAMPEP_0172494146 /NCGR_PEP_ID=MMETSP1066-20121228/39634_1 /TAXON_ID=671091 /ORGANISM="Coscinodiscus wailesii, Strain CCMP2513" /LENGTH=107 /DNA_ID=CAMNT_0013264871 /DNA_START=189 /DNA_END=512 /DNA_ORIENTATION=+